MKCKFCQEECILGEYDGIYSIESVIYECKNHPLVVKHYVYYRDEYTYQSEFNKKSFFLPAYMKWHNTIVAFQYKGKTLYVNWITERGNRSILFKISKDMKYSNFMYRAGEHILTLHYHPPDLTPENVQTKIPLYLTFS